jgi:hypothetical protein
MPDSARRAQALALAKPKLTLDQLAKTFGRSSKRFKRLLRLSYPSQGSFKPLPMDNNPVTSRTAFSRTLMAFH